MNFEAAVSKASLPAWTNNGAGRVFFPRHASQLLPHNWAVLLRKGPGLDALLELWRNALRQMQDHHLQPDDQWALALVLRKLQESRLDRHTGATPDCVEQHGAADSAAKRRGSCQERIRIWRLRESFAASFKSADKSRLGFFPRYTRPLSGPVVITHALRPFPWPHLRSGSSDSRATQHKLGLDDVCGLFNNAEDTSWHRLALLTGRSASSYEMVYNMSSCETALKREGMRTARIAAPICRMLPPASVKLPHRAGDVAQAISADIAEPIDVFWKRLLFWRNTSGIEMIPRSLRPIARTRTKLNTFGKQ